MITPATHAQMDRAAAQQIAWDIQMVERAAVADCRALALELKHDHKTNLPPILIKDRRVGIYRFGPAVEVQQA